MPDRDGKQTMLYPSFLTFFPTILPYSVMVGLHSSW